MLWCPGRDGATVDPSPARGPCPECGNINVTVWKGGGYNMGTGGGGEKTDNKEQQQDKKKDKTQENYIRSLQQQIKILELEIGYLKKQIQVRILYVIH